MRRGRPPKPARLRELEGNAGHRPIRPEPQISRQLRPEPPLWLTPYGREAFLDVIDELFAAGVVSKIDTMAVCAFAEFAATFRSATEALQRMAVDDPVNGLVARMPSGAVVTHPLLAVKNRAQRDLLRAASELGLSPSGRVGLQGMAPVDDADAAIFAKYSVHEETGHA